MQLVGLALPDENKRKPAAAFAAAAALTGRQNWDREFHETVFVVKGNKRVGSGQGPWSLSVPAVRKEETGFPLTRE
jgi:hypothetical protein